MCIYAHAYVLGVHVYVHVYVLCAYMLMHMYYVYIIYTHMLDVHTMVCSVFGYYLHGLYIAHGLYTYLYECACIGTTLA